MYIVKDQQDLQLPVYVVHPENHSPKVRTLNRDLLLPCGFLPIKDQSNPPKNHEYGCVRPARSMPREEKDLCVGDESMDCFEVFQCVCGR